jgi:TM2 domain-containing membrane protein YozV
MTGQLFQSYKMMLLTVVLMLISFSRITSQEASTETNLFSYENRLKFGNHLYFEKDYLRAAQEYKEYLKFIDNDTVRFRFANCFFMIGRYKEAADNFKSIFYNSSLQDESRLAFYKSLFFCSDYITFRHLTLNVNYMPGKFLTEIKRLYYISYLMDNSVLPDSGGFYSSFPDSSKNEIRNFYNRKKFPEYKNPTTAALLSTLLPGLGKIYTGKTTDGITSFLVAGILTYLAIDNFRHKHNFRGWLFTGLCAFSYAGNIYGSAASAHIYNAGVKFNFDNDVKVYFKKRNYFLPENKF